MTEQAPPSLVLQSLLGLLGQQPLLGLLIEQLLDRPHVALGLSRNQRLGLLNISWNVNWRSVRTRDSMCLGQIVRVLVVDVVDRVSLERPVTLHLAEIVDRFFIKQGIKNLVFLSNCFTVELDHGNFEKEMAFLVCMSISRVMVGTGVVMSEIIIQAVRCIKQGGF